MSKLFHNNRGENGAGALAFIIREKMFFVLSTLFAALISPASYAEERLPIIVDNYSGFALDGFDPVSYFTDGQPQPGTERFEARFGGLSWRFANAGNRKAFLISPQVYIPQFGGHDPISLSREFVTRGDPQTYLIYKDQLYFFHTAYAREEFLMHPLRTIRAAQQNWIKLKDGRD
jgi:hypothetical protein